MTGPGPPPYGPMRPDVSQIVTVETPGWVRDAVFYEIFPDRFALEPAGHQAGHARTVGRPADVARVQGR